MNRKCAPIILAVLSLIFLFSLNPRASRADDLDDGISIDDSITDYDKIKVGLNLRYIKRSAISKASVRGDSTTTTSLEGADVVQGGVIVKPGGETGDIIIIYEGKDNDIINSN